MDNLNLTALFRKGVCTLISNGARSAACGNSVLTSGLLFNLGDGLFPDANKVQTTTSLVEIRGKSEEPTHFHTSHLMGIVIHGEGYLRLQDNSRLPVKRGDMVIIPKGAYHYFDCDDEGELDYIALELSDVGIDYQKHFVDHTW